MTAHCRLLDSVYHTLLKHYINNSKKQGGDEMYYHKHELSV